VKVSRLVEWVVSEREGDVFFRWGYSEGDLVAEWGGLLTLRATRSGELKDLRAVPGASSDLVEKARHGVARAFLRAQRKQHSLHGSAVAWEGQGFVCVGASGLGKSTMAYRLCRRPGVELLADDITAIEVVPGHDAQVAPTERALWLATDRPGHKAPVAVSQVAPAEVPLRWIVSLAFDEGVSDIEVRDLRGGDAVAMLLPSLIRFERTAEQWARELEFLGGVVSHCRIVQLTRSRRSIVDDVAQALFALLTGKRR
jgi:hypothetical protein